MQADCRNGYNQRECECMTSKWSTNFSLQGLPATSSIPSSSHPSWIQSLILSPRVQNGSSVPPIVLSRMLISAIEEILVACRGSSAISACGSSSGDSSAVGEFKGLVSGSTSTSSFRNTSNVCHSCSPVASFLS